MNKRIDLEAKRLQNATVLILGREKDDLLGILSIESTDSDYLFTINKAKMKRISEAEANRIVEEITSQAGSLPIIGINNHTKEKKVFDMVDLSIEKVILSS